MANTNFMKTEVERYVVQWLEKEFERSFARQYKLRVGCKADGTPATHAFDAVSLDRSRNPVIVTAIKAHSGKTSGGKRPAGKINSAYKDLYLLSLVEAPTKVLVLTDAEFFKIFQQETQGKLASGIEVRYCALPEDIQDKLRAVQRKASQEMGYK